MSANTSIEWTDHTASPWWGCTKVSPGCANCYAECLDKRFHRRGAARHWGAGSTRRVVLGFAKTVRGWDSAARRKGERHTVFPSMCDPFEDHRDLSGIRDLFWDTIRETPNLRWLLLTKRPENLHLLPRDVAELVALGVSVENQEAADRRIPLLLAAPAEIRFVSCEPMLGPVNLKRRFPCPACGGVGWIDMGGYDREWCAGSMCRGIDWVICGGESGPKARPMHPDWVRSLRDQCAAASVPFLFKQWGEFRPSYPAEPYATSMDGQPMTRCGKLAAGRLLDGREHLEFPANLREARQ